MNFPYLPWKNKVQISNLVNSCCLFSIGNDQLQSCNYVLTFFKWLGVCEKYTFLIRIFGILPFSLSEKSSKEQEMPVLPLNEDQ